MLVVRYSLRGKSIYLNNFNNTRNRKMEGDIYKVIVAKSHKDGYQELYGKDAEVSPRIGDDPIDLYMLEEAFNAESVDDVTYSGLTMIEHHENSVAVWSLTRDVEKKLPMKEYKINGEWVNAYRGETLGDNDIFVIDIS